MEIHIFSMQSTTAIGLVIAFMGILVLVITQSITTYVPDRIDVAKRVVDDLQVIQSSEISTAWKNAASQDLNSFDWSQQDLNALDMYQKTVAIKEIGLLFGSIFALLGTVLSILSPAVEFIPKLFTD